MPNQVALITIHGMGETPSHYHHAFVEHMRQALGSNQWNEVIFRSVYYQKDIQRNQQQIFSRMRPHIDWKKSRKFLLYAFSDAASLEHRKEQPNSAYSKAQQQIYHTLNDIYQQTSREIPVIFVAYSLGCQLLSNYIWDATPGNHPPYGIWKDQHANGGPQDNFTRLRSLQRLYTLGCNIPIFVAGNDTITAIDKPNPDFQWINLYDDDDVLGWPLQPLSDSYQQRVLDIAINANSNLLNTLAHSWNPLSHMDYWTDNDVIEQVTQGVREQLERL